MRHFTLDSPAHHAGRKDHWLICDSVSEFADLPGKDDGYTRDSKWAGASSLEEAKRMARTGDTSLVPRSDKYLTAYEAEFPSSRRMWQDNVSGAFPNIGAYLAGSPCSMRNRVRTTDNTAPLTIFYDGALSAMCSQEQMERRGVAVLALVRMLAGRRPVELWYVCGLDADKGENAAFVTARIDTSPLDLARACHMLTSLSATRVVAFSAAHKAHGYTGRWPYGMGALSVADMETCLKQAFPDAGEMLCIPGMHGKDPLSKNPEQWLRDRLAQYAGPDI